MIIFAASFGILELFSWPACNFVFVVHHHCVVFSRSTHLFSEERVLPTVCYWLSLKQ